MRFRHMYLKSAISTIGPPFITVLQSKFSTIPISYSKLTLDHPILSALESCSNMKELQRIHSKMIIVGLVQDIFAASRLVKFCSISPSGSLDYSLLIFNQILEPDIFTWNIMIKGYALSPNPEKSLFLYNRMMLYGSAVPNGYTYPVLIKACSHMRNAQVGAKLHGHIVKIGFESVVPVQNSLIHMYSSCGSVMYARQLFDESPQTDVVSWNSMVDALAMSGDFVSAQEMFDRMPERNVVSWNVMINGFVRTGLFKEALSLFDEMQARNVKPNEPTMVNLISACAHMGAIDQGRWLHAYIDKAKLFPFLVLYTALIDMYAKCGNITAAEDLFEKTLGKDLVTWNTMINGHAMHGNAWKALDLFEDMDRAHIKPDKITFVGVLTACSHAGLVDKGCVYFDLMTRVHCIEPEYEHYGCMVDLLGRAGHLCEAEALIKSMPIKNEPSIWGALLNACRIHGDVELGKRVGEILLELEPHNCGRYALIWNIYAEGGMGDAAARVRKMMKDRGIKKIPGSSSIDLNGLVHEFVSGDQSHFEFKRIHCTLDHLTLELRREGYVPCRVHPLLDLD